MNNQEIINVINEYLNINNYEFKLLSNDSVNYVVYNEWFNLHIQFEFDCENCCIIQSWIEITSRIVHLEVYEITADNIELIEHLSLIINLHKDYIEMYKNIAEKLDEISDILKDYNYALNRDISVLDLIELFIE